MTFILQEALKSHKKKLAKDLKQRVEDRKKDILEVCAQVKYNEVDEKEIQRLWAYQIKYQTSPKKLVFKIIFSRGKGANTELANRCKNTIYETVKRKIDIEIKYVVQDFFKHHTQLTPTDFSQKKYNS